MIKKFRTATDNREEASTKYKAEAICALSFILILLLSAAVHAESYNSNPGVIDNGDKGELTLWSFNADNIIKSMPEGFYLADILPRLVRNQTLEFNQSLNCIDLKTYQNSTGMLYVSGLYPTTDSTVTFELGVDQDGRSASSIKSSNCFIAIRCDGKNYRLYSFWTDNNNATNGLYFEIPVKSLKDNKIKFDIISDERKRINTIKYNKSIYLKTPYVNPNQRDLPYTYLTQPIIQIHNNLSSNNTYCTLHIYNIEQKIPRRVITPYGTKTKSGFGLDGPHDLIYIMGGINYMTDRGHVGTIWADIRYLDESKIAFIKNLLNNGWGLGIHYSKELTTLPLKDAYSLMDSEYAAISDIFSTSPTTWCSLENKDNITHAIYAYKKHGMIWRNGNAGVNYLPNVGNLDNNSWYWWYRSANNSVIYPTFTHRLDQKKAIKYSIDYSKFRHFIDVYTNKNIQMVGFEEYYKKNINQKEANITILEKNDSNMIFSVKTNGYPCNVNVLIENISPAIKILDMTSNETLRYDLNDDKSITFETKNMHTYKISFPTEASQSSESGLFAPILRYIRATFSFMQES